MLTRCTNPNSKSFKNYGGRGIAVCDQWREFNDFAADIESAIGSRPDGMTLDRVDVNGNYEIGNIRWATGSEQARNTRRAATT
jgi:hypothetical protein